MARKKVSLKEGIVRNSIWNLSASFFYKIGALIFTIILARVLMPERYGIYSIVFPVAMIFLTFSDLGINKSLIVYISGALKKDKKKVPSYHSYLLKLKLVLILFASILLLLLSYPLAFYVFRNLDLFVPFAVASAFIFVLSLEGFYTSLFYSIDKVKYVNNIGIVGQLMRIVFAMFVVGTLAASYQIIGIIIALTLISLFLLLLNLFYLKKLIPDIFKKSTEKIDKKRVKKFVKYLTIASISAVFFVYLDSIILGIFLQPEFVGYYRVSFSLIFGIAGILSSPNLVLLSYFRRLHGEKLDSIFKQAFRYISIFTIPSVFGIIVLGKYFIQLFYGSSYISATIPLYFSSPLIFFTISVNLFYSLFASQEKPKIFAKIIIVATILNIILNIVFIKLSLEIFPNQHIFATAAVAIATTMSWIFYFVGILYFTKREFDFSIPTGSLTKPLFASIIMVIFLYFFLKIFTNVNLLFGIFLIILGMIVYFIIMFLIGGINKQDFEIVKLLLK